MNKEIYTSYDILSQVYLDGSYASIVLNKVLSTQKSTLNSKLVTKLVYGVIERDISLEYILNQFVAKQPPKRVQLILKMGLYMHLFLNSIPAYTIVNELVNLTKTIPEKHLSGFVNGTLKNIINGKINLPKKAEDLLLYYSVKYGYPTWLIEFLLQDLPEQQVEQLLATKLTTDTHIRLKDATKKQQWYDLLQNNNIRFAPSMNDMTMYVDYFALLQHPEWKKYYVVQGCPSMIVVDNVGKGSKFLDVCSAPGGKSVLLAQSNLQSEVVASDLYPHRVQLVEEFAKSQNLTNIKTIVQDATQYREDWKESFDAVICDVPCSGTGVIGKKPDILLNRTPDNIEELVGIQSSIIDNCSKYVKKGGRLIYSTCSILKKENQDIVRQFLKKHPEYTLKKVETYGIPVIEDNNMATFYPHVSKTEGFFIAVMEKI